MGRPRHAERSIGPVPRTALTRSEAAASLGISIDSFERYVQPFIRQRMCGQLVLVRPAELDRWMREGEFQVRPGED